MTFPVGAADMRDRDGNVIPRGTRVLVQCEGCTALFEWSVAPGQTPRWHSDRCRKQTLYAQPCVDCGTETNGSDGRVDVPRCRPCASAVSGAERKVWTRERIIAALQWWASEFGEPPAIPDLSATHSRYLGDSARAERAERLIHAGHMPHFRTVVKEFGTWNEGISAAGFEARAPHGGGGNELRRRVKAVA